MEGKILNKKEVIKQAKKDYQFISTEWTLQEYIDDLLQALEDDGYTLF